MGSIVLELQRQAADGSKPLPDVLRMARMVATKLKLPETNSWIEYELHGYPTTAVVPEYRVLHSDVQARNPRTGGLMPFRLDNPEVHDMLATVKITQSIDDLYLLVNATADFLEMNFTEHQMSILRGLMEPRMRTLILPFRKLAKPQVGGIIHQVRNRILDWTLKLESEGILGEGFTFTPQEKERASSMTSINIGSVGNIHGVVGSVSGSTVNVENPTEVDKVLKAQGLTDQQRSEIQQLIAEHKDAKPDGKLAVAKRAIAWVAEKVETLGPLVPIFLKYFGGGA